MVGGEHLPGHVTLGPKGSPEMFIGGLFDPKILVVLRPDEAQIVLKSNEASEASWAPNPKGFNQQYKESQRTDMLKVAPSRPTV